MRDTEEPDTGDLLFLRAHDRAAHPSAGGVVDAFGGVVDSLGVGVVVADLDGHARHANPAWSEMTGQGESETAGLGWLDVLSQSDRPKIRRRITATVRDDRTYDDTWRIGAGGASPRWLRVSARPQRSGSRPTGMVVTVTDVTDERARTAELLHAATHDALTGVLTRTQFIELVRHALGRLRRQPERVEAVLFIDVDRLKRVNDRSGHQASDRLLIAAGQCIQRVLRPSDAVGRFGGDEFVVLCDDLHDRDEAVSIAERIIEAAGAPGNGTEPIGLSVGIAFAEHADDQADDLIHRADQAMYRAKRGDGGRYELSSTPDSTRSARGVTRSARRGRKGRAHVPPEVAPFVAVAAHELRTPLTAILGMAGTLGDRRDEMHARDVDDAIDTIVFQGTRMATLIDNLLDLSRLASRISSNRTPVALAGVVTDALALVPPPEPTTVTFEGSNSRLAVLANEVDLQRVVVNLLTNAYRYGGPHVVIELRDERPHGVLAVRDDGPGVPLELAGRLFEPFSRGDNVRGRVGSGLGLAISRGLVESWNGTLSLAPTDPGCEFDVRLPVAPGT